MLIANLLTTMSFAPSVFLVHFLTLALSRSFFSGASQAWLYSELESRKESEQFKDILGTSRSLSLLSRTIAWIVGGYIVEFNSHYIYGLTAFSSLIALASAITISDRTTTQKADRQSPIRALKLAFLRNRELRWALVQGSGIFVMVRMVQVNLFQPILLDKGYDVKMLGHVLAFMTISEAIGSKYTTFFSNKFGLKAATFYAILSVCAAMSLFGICNYYTSSVNFILFSFFIGVAMPLTRQILNDSLTTPGVRATFYLSNHFLIEA